MPIMPKARFLVRAHRTRQLNSDWEALTKGLPRLWMGINACDAQALPLRPCVVDQLQATCFCVGYMTFQACKSAISSPKITHLLPPAINFVSLLYRDVSTKHPIARSYMHATDLAICFVRSQNIGH